MRWNKIEKGSRRNVFLPDRLYSKMERAKLKLDKSVSQIIREAVELYLEKF